MDFHERALLLGKPPQVLLITMGNCSNDDLISALDLSWTSIEAELTAGARLVTLRPGRLEVLA
jgi:predicted nuclease of predicted toxin-antitoxin system